MIVQSRQFSDLWNFASLKRSRYIRLGAIVFLSISEIELILPLPELNPGLLPF